MSTVYFCWVCDAIADPALTVRETGNESRDYNFCTPGHQSSYLWLANL